MGFTATLIFYLLIGGGVAFAVLVVNDRRRLRDRLGRGALAVVFWPLFVPMLLTRPVEADRPVPAPNEKIAPSPDDELAQAIRRVEQELDAALRSLDGWAEEVLALEQERIAELRATWHAHAARIRALDRLLDSPGFAEPPMPADDATPDEADDRAARLRHSAQVRRENIERLRQVRRRMHDDLVGTLAWVRELVTMILLAKFTGAPASRAEELVARIAAAVEGLSEVSTWADEPLAPTA
ncbi:MAG: hypothetical protein WED34_01200 [Planctomycetales bacterium]